MRISDWSSDVCSSDLRRPAASVTATDPVGNPLPNAQTGSPDGSRHCNGLLCRGRRPAPAHRVDEHVRGSTADRACRSRSEEHTSELQSLMRISYAVFCLKKKKKTQQYYNKETNHTVTTA